jgi:L-fucose isomerase-like protein
MELYNYRVGVLTEGAELGELDVAIIVVVTGGTEHLILELSKMSKITILLAHETMNSLPAALEALSKLREDKRKAWLFFGEGIRDKIKRLLRAKNFVDKLSKMRIGLIGEPSPWLVYSAGSRRELSRRFGIKFKDINIDMLYRIYEETPDPKETQIKDLLGTKIASEIPKSSLIKSIRLYLALKELINRESLYAVTIRCFDMIKDLKTTACLPLALLNSEGIIAGCEGDVPALFSMIIGKEMSGKPTFMGNLAWIHDKEVMVAHCTIPLLIVNRFSLKTHFESGLGVGVAGEVRKGTTVTMLRYDAKRNLIRVARGSIKSGVPTSLQHCRTQLIISIDGEPDKLIKDPIGNHQVIVFDDIREELRYLAELLNIMYEEL